MEQMMDRLQYTNQGQMTYIFQVGMLAALPMASSWYFSLQASSLSFFFFLQAFLCCYCRAFTLLQQMQSTINPTKTKEPTTMPTMVATTTGEKSTSHYPHQQLENYQQFPKFNDIKLPCHICSMSISSLISFSKAHIGGSWLIWTVQHQPQQINLQPRGKDMDELLTKAQVMLDELDIVWALYGNLLLVRDTSIVVLSIYMQSSVAVFLVSQQRRGNSSTIRHQICFIIIFLEIQHGISLACIFAYKIQQVQIVRSSLEVQKERASCSCHLLFGGKIGFILPIFCFRNGLFLPHAKIHQNDQYTRIDQQSKDKNNDEMAPVLCLFSLYLRTRKITIILKAMKPIYLQ